MTRERRIAIQPIAEAALAPFGRAVGISSSDSHAAARPPDAAGDGWACWYPVGELRDAAPLLIGLVRTDPRSLQVEALERHDDREEWVYALDQPVVQVVALSASGQPDWPDAASAAAFLLQPGQGVVVERGVWHSAGLPAGQRSVCYGFVLGPPRPGAPPTTNPWIPFAGGERLILEFPPNIPEP